MNEQLSSCNFSGDLTNIPISSTLVSMQIQALRESLQRLADSEDEFQIELPDNQLEDQQSKSTC